MPKNDVTRVDKSAQRAPGRPKRTLDAEGEFGQGMRLDGARDIARGTVGSGPTTLVPPDNATMIGRHLLLDLYGVEPPILRDRDLLTNSLADAAARCGLNALADPVLYPFPGGGLTGFLVLAESHISIHTYPDLGFAAVDIFSCGPTSPLPAVEIFRDRLRPRDQRLTQVERGDSLSA